MKDIIIMLYNDNNNNNINECIIIKLRLAQTNNKPKNEQKNK